MNTLLGNSKTDKSPIIQKFLSSSPLSPQNIEQLRKNIRQECKLRLKNKRRELFNKSRTDLENVVSNEFQKVSISFQQELFNNSGLFNELDLKILQDVEQDILNEQKHWFSEELTRLVDEYENIDDQYSRLNAIMCPLCLTGTLTQVNRIVLCTKCNQHLSHHMELDEFKSKIDSVVEQHQNLCSSSPSFTLVPNEFNSPCLLMICMNCQNCCSI
ncbi:hypothetical protein M8J75_008217 [Diaphorina citri]|nr:hypothetical protein M8J77_016073 [Diaphorina citri]KAI5704734.1 hypothetical protein M8J75_008217 [Diaphorina citri]